LPPQQERAPIDEAVQRLAICRTCEHHRRDDMKYWCDKFDDNHSSNYNCSRSKYARCTVRLLRRMSTCDEWSRKLIPHEDSTIETAFAPMSSLCHVCTIDMGPITTIHEVHRAVGEIIHSDLQPPATFKLPRCIVTAGEGMYEDGIVIMVRLLRDNVKCGIPIKIFHKGPWRTDLSNYENVELIDTRAMQPAHPAKEYGGWAAKTYAVMHADAERVMWLDADAYPVRDPTPLFNLLDNHRYILWADYGPGEACDEMPNPVRHHQNGGEYLVNMRTYWREMMATRFLDNHSRIYWSTRKNGQSYRSIGDECSTRLVRSLISDKGVLTADWVRRTRGVGILCCWRNHPYVAHRMRRESKLILGRVPVSNPKWPYEKEVMRYFAEVSPGFPILRPEHLGDTRDEMIKNRERRLAAAGRKSR